MWLRPAPVTPARGIEARSALASLVMMGAPTSWLALRHRDVPDCRFGADAGASCPGIGFDGSVPVCGGDQARCYRGGVRWRIAGAAVFLVVTLVEALGNAIVLDVPPVQRFDTGLSVIVAGGTVLLAAFYWTRRTASPNPLGSDSRPFDY